MVFLCDILLLKNAYFQIVERKHLKYTFKGNFYSRYVQYINVQYSKLVVFFY